MKASITAAVAAIVALTVLAGPFSAHASHSRPKAATSMRASLVPAFAACGAPNRAHAAPFSTGSCNPPVQTSPNVTIGSPDANVAPAKNAGSVVVRVVGVAGGIDDQDVTITVDAADIRCGAGTTACGSANGTGPADYVGGLEANAPMQLTDHNSGPTGTGSDPATMVEFDFPFEIPCTATVDNTVGSTCAVATSMDAQVPGAIPEVKRINVEFQQVEVWDGGADGDIFTPDNSLAFVQGIFVP